MGPGEGIKNFFLEGLATIYTSLAEQGKAVDQVFGKPNATSTENFVTGANQIAVIMLPVMDLFDTPTENSPGNSVSTESEVSSGEFNMIEYAKNNSSEVVESTAKGAANTDAAGSSVSPNVQKALNTLNDIKAEGGTVKANPTSPNQEINMTVKTSTQKLDVRVETHTVPQKYGGNGVTPQKHMNVDLYPNKDVLPNNGHKILEE
jgi:hypothetical protein